MDSDIKFTREETVWPSWIEASALERIENPLTLSSTYYLILTIALEHKLQAIRTL